MATILPAQSTYTDVLLYLGELTTRSLITTTTPQCLDKLTHFFLLKKTKIDCVIMHYSGDLITTQVCFQNLNQSVIFRHKQDHLKIHHYYVLVLCTPLTYSWHLKKFQINCLVLHCPDFTKMSQGIHLHLQKF